MNSSRRPLPYSSERPLLFLLLGDSLTERGYNVVIRTESEIAAVSELGWVHRLQSTYVRTADILNRGFSGYTTRLVKSALSRILDFQDHDHGHSGVDGGARYPIDCAVVWLGANDAAVESSIQHVGIEEFAQNLEEIVQRVRRVAARVIVVGCTPVIHDKYHAHCIAMGCSGADRNSERARAYAERARAVTQKCASSCSSQEADPNIVFVDMFSELERAAKIRSVSVDALMSDGLHFSPLGQLVVYDVLEPHFPSAARFLPYWKDAVELNLPLN
eukprot:ANDGO_06982.mRNA.1 GDSL esterase/lipase At5g62930